MFLTFTVLIIYFANERQSAIVGGLLLLFILLFFTLVKYHNKIAFRKTHFQNLKEVNQLEIDRQENNYKNINAGIEFNDPLHPYVSDLDIFGNHSIFQLLNRCATRGGRGILASWLSSGTNRSTILQRQEASKEIAGDLDWRQDLQAHGMHFHDELDMIKSLKSWLNSPDYFKSKGYYKILMWLLPIATILLFTLVIIGYSYQILFPIIIINSLVISSTLKIMATTTKLTDKGGKVLKLYGNLIEMIETRSFKSPLFQEIKENIEHENFKASLEIQKLQNILYNLENRANIVYWLLNIFLVLDLYWLIKAENWKKRNGHFASQWFNVVHQFEAINSLAGFHYANPTYCFPTISEDAFHFDSIALGHPLIKNHERVSNNFKMVEKTIAIVTGSNMSGKSTFLRTIGTNQVLAQAGAVTCAKSYSTSLCQVFTGMRTQDDLKESVSSFYAELKRLRQLLEMVNNSTPVLYFLDEILKGTNSKDRFTGASSLIHQLSQLNAYGFVSTHDLNLGKMAEINNMITNYSFNSHIDNEEIAFDYKISHGLCHTFNATKLMEKMGIKITSEFEENELN